MDRDMLNRDLDREIIGKKFNQKINKFDRDQMMMNSNFNNINFNYEDYPHLKYLDNKDFLICKIKEYESIDISKIDLLNCNFFTSNSEMDLLNNIIIIRRLTIDSNNLEIVLKYWINRNYLKNIIEQVENFQNPHIQYESIKIINNCLTCSYHLSKHILDKDILNIFYNMVYDTHEKNMSVILSAFYNLLNLYPLEKIANDNFNKLIEFFTDSKFIDTKIQYNIMMILNKYLEKICDLKLINNYKNLKIQFLNWFINSNNDENLFLMIKNIVYLFKNNKNEVYLNERVIIKFFQFQAKFQTKFDNEDVYPYYINFFKLISLMSEDIINVGINKGMVSIILEYINNNININYCLFVLNNLLTCCEYHCNLILKLYPNLFNNLNIMFDNNLNQENPVIKWSNIEEIVFSISNITKFIKDIDTNIFYNHNYWILIHKILDFPDNNPKSKNLLILILGLNNLFNFFLNKHGNYDMQLFNKLKEYKILDVLENLLYHNNAKVYLGVLYLIETYFETESCI